MHRAALLASPFLLTLACQTANDDVYDGPAFGTVAGFVYDLDDQPVEGATVELRAQGLSAVTNADGRYVLDGVTPGEDLVIRFDKTGYAEGFTRASLISWETVSANKRIMEVDGVGSFDAAQGGVVSTDDLRITFDPNTIVDAATGELYTGVVTVEMTWVDPYDDAMLEVAPGDLQALAYSEDDLIKSDTPTTPAQLISYGMTSVELSSAEGSDLDIADGALSTVEMRITNGDLSSFYQVDGESEIPSWSWDEELGTWMQELTGQAYDKVIDYDADGNPIDWDNIPEGEELPEVAETIEELWYTFDAPHFSWWNSDQGYQATCAEGRVLDVLGFPVRGARVEARGALTTSLAYTDEDGLFEITVMAGDSVTFKGETDVADVTWSRETSAFIDCPSGEHFCEVNEDGIEGACYPVPDLEIQVCREAGIVMTDNIEAHITTMSGANADRLRAWFWEPPGDVEYCENPWDALEQDSCESFDPDDFDSYSPDVDGFPHELRSVGSWLELGTSRNNYKMNVEYTDGKPFYRFITEEVAAVDVTSPEDLDGYVSFNEIDIRGGDVLSAQSSGSSSLGNINEENWVTIPEPVVMSGVNGPISATTSGNVTMTFDGQNSDDGLLVFGAGMEGDATVCRFQDDGSLTLPSSVMGTMGAGTAGLSVFRAELDWVAGPDGLPIRVQAFSGQAVQVDID